MVNATDSQRVEEILSAVPIFARLNKRDLKKLGKLCVAQKYSAGDLIIEEGAIGLGMFVITSGRVEVFKASDGGKIALGAMEEGDVLGEIALVDDQPRSASAVAQTETECLLLTRDSFESLVKNEPEIAWCIVPSLAERVRELHERALQAEEQLREGRKKATEESAAGAGAEKSKDQDDADEDEESEAWDAAMKMMRIQWGLMAGGLTAMTGMFKSCESFFNSLADETGVAESNSFSDIVDKSFDGFVTASRKAISELEDLPQDMVDSFRNICKEE